MKSIMPHKTYRSYSSYSNYSFYRCYGPHLLFSIFSLFALSLSSCRQRPVLYDYVPVNPHGWLTTDTLRFTLPAVPADGDYTFSLGTRFNSQYPYEDLWLVLEQRFVGAGDDAATIVGDECRRRDTLHLAMPTEKPTWRTNGIAFHEAEAPVTTTHLTPQQMPVELLVYHVMRHQCLTGITEVGVKVE